MLVHYMHMHQSRGFLFVLGGSRAGGNTELLARKAAEQLPPGTGQRWMRLTDLPLPPFEDRRHLGDGVYPQPSPDARTLLDATAEATDLVIVSPLYWYAVSSAAKRYLDQWSAWLRTPDADFRARMAGGTLWGVTALAGDDPGDADPLVGTLAKTAAYMGMRFGGVLLGNGTRPGDVLRDQEALRRAKTFFTP